MNTEVRKFYDIEEITTTGNSIDDVFQNIIQEKEKQIRELQEGVKKQSETARYWEGMWNLKHEANEKLREENARLKALKNEFEELAEPERDYAVEFAEWVVRRDDWAILAGNFDWTKTTTDLYEIFKQETKA